jgi:hypothetical protein
MIALLGSLLGFASSAVPDIFKIFQERADRKHELEIIKLQMKQQEQGHIQRLEEINTTADIAETKAIYKTYNTGITWVDALNGTVRPVLAYAFFLLYAAVKISQLASHPELPLAEALPLVWSDEDSAIFAGIVSFYFGQRAMQKVRQGK